jgi:hypothetical protein
MSRPLAAALVLASILATTRVAHAEYIVLPEEPDLRDDVRSGRGRVFGQLGYAGGERELGTGTVEIFGLMFGLGIQRGKYSLIGELHIGDLDARPDPDPALSGFSIDAGLHVRRAVSWVLGDRELSATVGVFVDAGAGVELMWFGNDRVYRPNVSLGIGGGFEFFGRRNSLGVTFDVRMVAAPAVEWDGTPSRCAGACGMTFSTIDVTTLGLVVFPFTL